MSLAISIGADSVSFYKDGEFHMVEKSHANYPAILEELRKPESERDESLLMDLADIPRAIAKLSAGRVSAGPDGIYFKDGLVGGYMAERLMSMMSDGIDVTPWMLFMDNLMDNPHAEVRDDLFKWMENGKMPITPQGEMIAFKKVRDDYTDVHSGKFDNSPGSVLEMDRTLCDPNRNNTCSTGFHFCSQGYLHSFGGSRIMAVVINPRDVTAIPKDYNLTKGRCCKYTVQAELRSQSQSQNAAWYSTHVVDLEDPREFPEEILVPRKKPSEFKGDPARASGPAPADYLADRDSVVEVPTSPPAKKKSGSKRASAAAPKESAVKKPTTKKSTAAKKPAARKAKPAATESPTLEPLPTVTTVDAAVGTVGGPVPTVTGRVRAKNPAQSNPPRTEKAAPAKAPARKPAAKKATAAKTAEAAPAKAAPKKKSVAKKIADVVTEAAAAVTESVTPKKTSARKPAAKKPSRKK